MNDETSTRIFEKLDAINDSVSNLRTDVEVLTFKVESHSRPCPELKQLLERHERDDDEVAEVKKQTKAWLVIALIGLCGAAVLFAVKNGWTP